MEIYYTILNTYVRNNKVTVDCLCHCGRMFTTPKTRLDRGRRSSCNKGACDFNVRKNIGLEVGPYKVLAWNDRRKRYKCLCKFCGKETFVAGMYLKINKKCGECCRVGKQENKRRVKCLVLSSLYNKYKYEAVRRDLTFNLTIEEFEAIVIKNCVYCNSLPFKRRSVRKEEEDKNYSGVDRIDNSQGYYLQNSVPCCINCNRAKSDLDLVFWLNSIKSIYERLNLDKEISYNQCKEKLTFLIETQICDT